MKEITNEDILEYLKKFVATKAELEELKADFRSKVDGINRRIDRMAEDIGDMRYSLKEQLDRLNREVFKE